jgi:ribosomal protein S18 acetylase RimI-like enzyme
MKKTAEISVRQMELKDIPKVVSLGEKLFTAENLPLLYRTWDEGEVLNVYSGDAEFCLVATAGRQVVGFTLGTFMGKPNGGGYGWLNWIGVASRHRRRGTARKLVDALAAQFREADAQFLMVDTDETNAAAARLFASSQFGAQTRHIYFARQL